MLGYPRGWEGRRVVGPLSCVLGCGCFVGVRSRVVGGVLVRDFGRMFLAVFLSLVMRLSCVVSDFVRGECSLVFMSLEGGWAIGHISC